MEEKWVVRVAFVRPGSIVQQNRAAGPMKAMVSGGCKRVFDKIMHFGRRS